MTPALMHHSLRDAARRWPRRTALRAGDLDIDFATLDEQSTALARYLRGAGVEPGVRVAVMTATRPEFVLAVEAISKAGGVVVLMSPAWKPLEVGNAVSVAEPALAIADGTGTRILSDLLGSANVLDVDSAAFSAVLTHSRETLPSTEPDLDTEALLVFSSGTVGLPKAVRHTHTSIWHAVQHWRATLDVGPEDRFQVATPPSHILGVLNLLTAIDAGATVRLHQRFDLDELLRRIQDEQMTLEMAVAPIALAIANHPDLEAYDLSSLRYIMWGATPVAPNVAETVTRRTGVRWLAAYGTSEVPVVAVNPVSEPDRWRLDSPGLAPSGVRLRVADLETGKVLAPGETGEIQVLSPSAMTGYLPATANTDALADGWYRTGDVGWLEPDGWVHLTDRSKELIKVNAFQVAPAEIESVLLGYPGVADCAVFGIFDERTGERPVAAVRLLPGSDVTPDELIGLVAESLATYKQVHTVLIVPEIPRLPSGKALRRVLRKEWEQVLAAPDHEPGYDEARET